jgi:hypothetical protein
MARYLQQAKATFGSPTTFKDALQTTNGNGKVRYNQDLLPSPPGQFPSIHIQITHTDTSQRTGDGDGNITFPTILL